MKKNKKIVKLSLGDRICAINGKNKGKTGVIENVGKSKYTVEFDEGDGKFVQFKDAILIPKKLNTSKNIVDTPRKKKHTTEHEQEEYEYLPLMLHYLALSTAEAIVDYGESNEKTIKKFKMDFIYLLDKYTKEKEQSG